MKKFVKPINDALIELQVLAENINMMIDIVPTFENSPKETLSCIVHAANRDRFGIMSINVDGAPELKEEDSDEINYFVFNGKLYDYCKQEGFSKDQMINDESFENKVIIRKTKNDFFDFILND